jgi:hypothetical protein
VGRNTQRRTQNHEPDQTRHHEHRQITVPNTWAERGEMMKVNQKQVTNRTQKAIKLLKTIIRNILDLDAQADLGNQKQVANRTQKVTKLLETLLGIMNQIKFEIEEDPELGMSILERVERAQLHTTEEINDALTKKRITDKELVTAFYGKPKTEWTSADYLAELEKRKKTY